MDPPSPNYDRLIAAYIACSQGIDLIVGRGANRRIRKTGHSVVHTWRGHSNTPHRKRQTSPPSHFLNNARDELMEGGLID
jgi:hypothetical protein